MPWRSRLVMGQASTNNSVFNSFQFRGVQLSSVDDMLPDSLRGYAPVVRGVAATNARVEIRQNGYVIYSTNVAPGPFEIHDVYPHTNNGDLQVTVNRPTVRIKRSASPTLPWPTCCEKAFGTSS